MTRRWDRSDVSSQNEQGVNGRCIDGSSEAPRRRVWLGDAATAAYGCASAFSARLLEPQYQSEYSPLQLLNFNIEGSDYIVEDVRRFISSKLSELITFPFERSVRNRL